MMQKIKLVAKLLLLQLTARSQNIPFSQLPFSNPLANEADSILHQQVKDFFIKAKSPGLIIGISKGGSKEFYSYGFADSASKRLFTAETVFEVGSITKTFTANLLFQLDEQGIIGAGKAAIDYLPEKFANDSVLRKVILADIASQSSGLPRLPANLDKIKEYTLMQPYQFYNRQHLYSFLTGLKKVSPGRYEYSNLGFGLLGTVMENATVLPFESLLNKYILQPLQMDNSCIEAKKNTADIATGYLYSRPVPYWQFDCLAGAGAIKSTADDLLKYLDAHLESVNTSFQTAVRRITKPVRPAAPNMQICFGWHTFEDLKHRVYWHNGGTYGFSTFAAFEPVTKISVILAANASGINKHLDKLATDLLILLMGK